MTKRKRKFLNKIRLMINNLSPLKMAINLKLIKMKLSYFVLRNHLRCRLIALIRKNPLPMMRAIDVKVAENYNHIRRSSNLTTEKFKSRRVISKKREEIFLNQRRNITKEST